MTITINGETVSLLPRVARMVKMLVLNQGIIEHCESAQIVIDYSPSRVVLWRPKQQLGVERIDRE